jgi:tetratricopeptide (TPR) repeat protein
MRNLFIFDEIKIFGIVLVLHKRKPNIMMRKTFFACILVALVPMFAAGQTLNEAKEAYNQGATLFATDKAGAITQFEKSLEICKAVGVDADSTRMKIEAYLPGLYFDLANNDYKEKKFAEALPKFEQAKTVAETYNDAKTKQKCVKALSLTNFNLGNNAFKANDLDNAIKYYEQAGTLDAQNSKIWLMVGQSYIKKDDMEKALPAMDKTIELALSANDTATENKVNNVVCDYLRKKAMTAYTKNDFTTSIAMFDKYIEYDNKDSEVYYMKALIFNKQSKYQDAVKAGDNAIKNLKNEANAPKIYIELGNAYMALKQNGEACAAYKKATVGPTAAFAKQQITKLACQ